MCCFVPQWLPELTGHCAGTPFVLVGTKVDQRTDAAAIEALRKQKLNPITLDQVNPSPFLPFLYLLLLLFLCFQDFPCFLL